MIALRLVLCGISWACSGALLAGGPILLAVPALAMPLWSLALGRHA